ncbi:hypothetical protein ACSSS7_000106 [Eimeria intestinalis]
MVDPLANKVAPHGEGSKPAASPPPTVDARWTDYKTYHSSALAELALQQRAIAESEPSRYLTFAERQRLLNAPASPLLPVLVAIGMLCVFSMSLAGLEGEGDFGKLSLEREEMPFVPHEAERWRERPQSVLKRRESEVNKANLALFQKKLEYLSRDDGAKVLNWVEKPLHLGDLVMNGVDSQVLLTQAPPHLSHVVSYLAKEKAELKKKAHGHFKVPELLQQDLIAVGELLVLCRILAEGGKLDEEQARRFAGLFEIVTKRFGEEWPEALGLASYCPIERQCIGYLRLVGVVATAVNAVGRYLLPEATNAQPAEGGQLRAKLLRKVMTERLELARALADANFPPDIAEAFRVD